MGRRRKIAINPTPELNEMPEKDEVGKLADRHLKLQSEIDLLKETQSDVEQEILTKLKAAGRKKITIDGMVISVQHISAKDKLVVKATE